MHEVHISPQDVWVFFHKNIDKIEGSSVIVAENVGTNYIILLTSFLSSPNFIVQKNNEDVYEEYCANEMDAETTYDKLIGTYLVSLDENDDEELEELILEEEIERRDLYLRDAATQFIGEIGKGKYEDEDLVGTEDFFTDDDFISRFIEHCIEFLSDELPPIYRPMYLMANDGNEYYVEYPYVTNPFFEYEDSLSVADKKDKGIESYLDDMYLDDRDVYGVFDDDYDREIGIY